MSTQDKQQELDSLKKLQAEIRTQRESAETAYNQVRSSSYTDWAHYDEVILNLADRRRQEESVANRIADLQRAINTQSQNLGSQTKDSIYQNGAWWQFYHWGYPYGVNQTVTVSHDRFGLAALIAASAALLVAIAAIFFALKKINEPVPVGSFSIQVTQPVQQKQETSHDCETHPGMFEIGEHTYAAIRVEPCAYGTVIPQNSVVYADSKLSMFGVPIFKADPNSNPNSRFVGYTADAVTLQGDDGFWYIQDLNAFEIAEDWKNQLEPKHPVGEVYILQQR